MDASLNKSGPRYTLAFERRLPHPPEKVWRALTEHELLSQWWPADVIGEWKVGAELRFEFRHGEGDGLPEEELCGEVLAVDPPRLLEFRWGSSRMRSELSPDGAGCLLRFSETFADSSVAARNAAGWEWCLENLATALQGGTVAKFVLDAWRGRFEHYVGRFEPEAGPQQGPPETHSAVAEETRPPA